MNNKRLWNLGLTGVLAVTACGCGNAGTAEESVKDTVAEAREEISQAAEIAEKAAARSGNKDAEKEETVYVNADASGNVVSITVSSWLKNGNGESQITDVTDLANVENVKGDETFVQDGNKYIWAANGSDIYYQGETSETLPVAVKVTYYLNDQKIDPEELAGKSGKVKIRFDYENLTAQKVEIGGEETEMCVPFAAASAMVLDSDKFVNVEAENGKILSDGKNTIVAGVAMPGLYESLDLANLEGFEDLDISEYVEVTADVTDFELDMTATILMPDVFSELNTDDMDGFDDLKDDIEELNDATYDLIDGCVELDDGVQELKDNMPDLWDGAVELDDGAVELDDGAQDLLDGADELNDGAKELRDGAGGLDDGVGTLQTGAKSLNDGMTQLNDGVNALAEGLQSLQGAMMLGTDGKSGSAEFPYIKSSAGLLKNGVDSLISGIGGMESGLEQAIAENQEKMQTAYSEVALLTGNLQEKVKEAQEIQGQLNELAKQMGLIPSEDSAAPAEPDDSVPEGSEEQNEESGKEAPEDNASEEQPEAGTAENSTEGQPETETAENPTEGQPEAENAEKPAEEKPEEETTENRAEEKTEEEMTENPTEEQSEAEPSESSAEKPSAEPESGADTEAELSDFAESYLDGLSDSDGMTPMGMVQTSGQEEESGSADPAAVIAGYQKVVALQTSLILKLNEITDLQNQLRDAAAAYAGLAGADTALKQLAGQLESSVDDSQLQQLSQGMAAMETSIGQIYDGIALINSQMGTLIGGAEELQQGSGALKDGTDTLKEGTKKLYEGGKSLREGSKELYEGTQDLKDGTEELRDGTQELKDGVVDLIDGVDELKDGTEELLDGVNEYNEDGIQKLYETVTVDLQNVLDRVDAVSDLSESYQSFSGKSEDMEGSVKFIIETDAIEME